MQPWFAWKEITSRIIEHRQHIELQNNIVYGTIIKCRLLQPCKCLFCEEPVVESAVPLSNECSAKNPNKLWDGLTDGVSDGANVLSDVFF